MAHKETAAAYLLLAVTAVESIHFNYITVSERQFVRKNELIDGITANRETIEAVANLALDDKSLYRMTVGGLLPRLDQNGLLVLQTPFAKGWRAFQDGRPAQTVRVDVGLLGVVLAGGEHKLELSYRNPWLIASAIVTLSALLLMGLALWFAPRLATHLET